MAIIKESSTLDITVMDDQMYEYVYKINNPKENLTLAEVREVYAPVITANLLYSKNGNLVNAVARAKTTNIVTTTTDLE